MTHDTLKQNLLTALYAWIRQRPGLDYGNYGNPTSYRQELRSIQRDLHDARRFLRDVELSSITGNELLTAFSAFSGRMEWKDGELHYCTGQYWPTEYRKCVAAIAANALWNYLREDYAKTAKDDESPGSAIRREFRKRYGRTIQTRWFG